MGRRIRVLAVDDDASTLELVAEALASESVEVLTAQSPEEGVAIARTARPEVAIIDLVLPGRNGIDMLDDILAVVPECDVVLLTGHYSTESAVEAIQRGASDYLTKPISMRDLRARIGEYVEEAQRRSRATEIEREAAEANRFHGIIGRSAAMSHLFARVRRIAPHYRTALVLGETGTGKELVARAVHQLSPVARGPFVVCNCSAIVETLFESEIFGHVKGSFTGATTHKVGYLEAADGGTLFLDELGDLPLSMQTKLLRAIQNQELQRVGSTNAQKVDVRIIGATNRDLQGMMAEGDFREDLYYRLAMVELYLPKLSERPEDIPLLVRHFIGKFASEYGKPIDDISNRAMAVLTRHQWPGNIRELENVIGQACMMGDGKVLDIDDLPVAYTTQRETAALEFPSSDLPTLAEMSRRYARHALEMADGNKARTAEILGISRATLYKMLAEEEKAMAEPQAG